MKKQNNRIRLFFVTAGWLVLTVLPIWTSAQTTNTTPATNTVQETVEPEAPLRDPFWPVGYAPAGSPTPVVRTGTKAPVVAPTTTGKPTWPQLKLKGITSDLKGGYMAILDTGIIVEGQILEQRQGNLIFRWRIDKITSQDVAFTQLEVQRAGK